MFQDEKDVDHHNKEDWRRFLSFLRPMMKHTIPFVSCMGHPSNYPIFKQKVVWYSYQLIIEGCGDSYKKRFRHKDPMTIKEVYHHSTNYYWKQDCSLHKVISIFKGYVNECCNFYIDFMRYLWVVLRLAIHASLLLINGCDINM